MPRPSASVVVPCLGSARVLAETARRFAALRLEPPDEVLIVDNSPRPHPAPALERVRIIHAGAVQSSYFARNAGAGVAKGEWLVFCDADTEPHPDLLDAYFDPAPGKRTAILAGGVRDHVEGEGVAARLARETASMDQRATLANPYLPYAITANCAIRTVAFREAEGFEPSVRSGGDADLCWRLQRLGWGLEERRGAMVLHRNRATMVGVWQQRARHGAGAAWLSRRYPGAMPPWSAPALARDAGRRLAGSARHLVRGDGRRALLEAAIVSGWLAFEFGRYTSNHARRR